MAVLHATTVAVDGQGVLITGPSGSGKSALALQLIALGARLVADDRTEVRRTAEGLTAEAPATIAGLIEARGLGLIRLPPAGPTPLRLVVDLARVEEKRLPEPHEAAVEGLTLPCLHRVDGPHFPSAILLYLKGAPGP